MDLPELTERQKERYARHLPLPEIGAEGQQRLLSARVLVIGAGGLGSSAILYASVAGIGTLGIVDSDVVELSNLQRQIIHTLRDIGTKKVVSAGLAVTAINPDCKVSAVAERLTVENARELVAGFDVVMDCSDNFPTRFLVADCCWLERIPLVSAAVYRFEGQLTTVVPGSGNPCYRCLYPEPPPPSLTPAPRESGPVGALVGVMGSLQVLETLKLLLGTGSVLSHEILLYDALDIDFRKMARARSSTCPLCGANPTITDLVEQETGREPQR